MVPRSMRQIAEWESANQLALLTVDLHTDVEDPVERLTRIRDSALRAKGRSSHPAVRRYGHAHRNLACGSAQTHRSLASAQQAGPFAQGHSEHYDQQCPGISRRQCLRRCAGGGSSRRAGAGRRRHSAPLPHCRAWRFSDAQCHRLARDDAGYRALRRTIEGWVHGASAGSFRPKS
ncbi:MULTISPECIES: WS/DGAT domain-containing protein [Rhodococcus]|uniref:WS/DGAT domain-containing protein n=1 Tax=Rhodococcus TaxID=1827 RepID=UPI0027E1E66B|nr:MULTISPECIES: WS/DGAT domain-containing protein [Rhodococcus]